MVQHPSLLDGQPDSKTRKFTTVGWGLAPTLQPFIAAFSNRADHPMVLVDCSRNSHAIVSGDSPLNDNYTQAIINIAKPPFFWYDTGKKGGYFYG